VLIDGHNRYEIATRLGLPFAVVAHEFATRDDAADWIDRNQLGRRNLHPEQFNLLLGRRFNRAKKAQGGDRKSADVISKRQSDALIGKTSERIASEHGVSTRTVERAGQFADAVGSSPHLLLTLPTRQCAGEGST
jgi:hypothetical protein